MPRPLPSKTPGAALWLGAALCCAALGPAAVHAALAAAAGTLFEAAPFVLFAEMLPAGRFRALVSVAGCGCGSAVPGALSLPAIGLCWLTFGPLVTLARTAAAAGLLLRRPGRRAAHSEPLDAFATLQTLAPAAAISTLLCTTVVRYAPHASATAGGRASVFGAGLLLGCLAPCGTAAIAVAAALAPHLSLAAAGVLCTGGLAPSIVRSALGTRLGRATPKPQRSAFLDRLALAFALATLACEGPRGFVNPRLVPLAAFGAAVALAGVRRGTHVRGALLTPALLFVALAAGSPEPRYTASETRLDDAYAGERVVFTGAVRHDGPATSLVRFAITCCRVDASPVAVRTALPLAVAEGNWVSARGVLERSPHGLVMRTSAWRLVRQPADPFVYR